MVPIYVARGLADGRGRRPVVARRPAALAPRAYGPLAI
jgi:hypothetical protein